MKKGLSLCDSVPGRSAGLYRYMYCLLYRLRSLLYLPTYPPSQPPIADLLNFGKIQTLFLNLSQYKIFHDFMHMRAKTICEFTAEFTAEFTSEFTAHIVFARICMKS